MGKIADFAEDGTLVKGAAQKMGLELVLGMTCLVLAVGLVGTTMYGWLGPHRWTASDHDRYDQVVQAQIKVIDQKAEKNEAVAARTDTQLQLIRQDTERMKEDLAEILKEIREK